MVNSLNFNNRTSDQFIDQVLLFSILPGLAILIFLYTDFTSGIRTLTTLLFLSFYPGYMLVRHLAIDGVIFKIVLSVGLSLSLLTAVALATLTTSWWNPVWHTTIIVLTVMADALIGKHSLLRPSPAEVTVPLIEDPSFRLSVNRPFRRQIYTRDYLIENRPNDQPKVNYIWGVEFLSIKNHPGSKLINVLVISDLLTRECLMAVPIKARKPEFIISQLSWLFLTYEAPRFLEISPINERDGYIYFNWLQQNDSTVGLIPPDQRDRPQAHMKLSLYLRRLNLSENVTLKQQLEAWKDGYNRGLIWQS